MAQEEQTLWIDKATQIYYKQNIDHDHPPFINDLSSDEQIIWFKQKFGIDPIKTNHEFIKKYLRASFPKILIYAIDDNWIDMLLAGLLIENNYPEKPPYEYYQTHSCYFRTLSICESIGDAYSYAKKKKDLDPIFIKILEYRIQLGDLIFDCCDRGDNRSQILVKNNARRSMCY